TRVNEWVKANPELTRQIVMVGGAATALITVLGGIGLVAWPVMAGINALIAGAGLLSVGFSMAGGVITTAMTALSLPILGVVAIFAGAIAAIVVGALLIRKYWEPIGAFFGGVLEGLKIAFAPIAELFAPLKPVFDWLGEKLSAAWEWFKQLVAPVKSTQETLDSCRNAGVAFGEMLANALTMPVQALNQLRGGIDWVLEKLGVIDKKSDGLGDKVPKEALTPEGAAALSVGVSTAPVPQGVDAKAIADRYSGVRDNGGGIKLGEFAVVGEHGPEIVEGPANVTSRKKTAAMASAAMNMSAYRPIAPTVQASAASSPVSIHAPISIVAQPGQSAQDIAQEVTRQLEQRERAARSRAYSQYSYQGG
ncbi:phage tail tape measure protein, partial [Pectobacterium aquaticum]